MREEAPVHTMKEIKQPVADQIAGYFGGGGHPYAAGFRTYDTTYEEAVNDLINATMDALDNLPQNKSSLC